MFDLSQSGLLAAQSYIDGQWIGADSGATFPVTNPSTGETIVQVADCGAAETERAIEAARRAGPRWAALTAKERANILRRWYELMMAAQDDLARLLTAEQGKPLAEAKGEIAYGASFIEWFAEEAKRIYGETIPGHQGDKRLVVIRQPVGVVGAITPWNFPNAMITRKVGPALAAGCTVVVKPSELTPLSATALAVLGEKAGIPAGVLNIVTGLDAPAIGGALTSSEKVAKITFTGSTEVGRILMRQSADTIKKMSLELGGNAPFIVFDDADLDAAVEGAILCKFRNAGQTCVCANRIYVQTGVHDAFAAKLKTAVEALTVGDGFEDGSKIGPLIEEAALDKVEAHIADAKAHGGEVILGGKRHDRGGLFFEPTLMTGVPADALITREETFGPVAPLIRFEEEAEAVRLANATVFGLASYFYARDLGRVWRVAETLESGIVGINTGIISTEVAPFGGVKQSGLGREGSKHGIEEYLEMKYLCMGL
ncbi:MAG: NAD-dependent succinate-semialdehyde dehydrogenase [Pseudomonadota bacterium]